MELEKKNQQTEILKNFEYNRYNTFDYLDERKEKGKLAKFSPIPIHIYNEIIKNFSNKKTPICVYLGIYYRLYNDQNEFNKLALPIREKCKRFFGYTERIVNPVLTNLEKLGMIVQKLEKHKKVIFVKYPEYIDHINNSKITIEEEIIERKIIEEKTTTRKIKIEPQEQNKIIESQDYKEISKQDQYNQEQLAKIQRDFKISIDNLSQEEIEKTIYNSLNKYIDWNNNIDKKSIIEKPVIFINKYLDNPLSLTIDFTQYYAYLKKLEKQKLIEENKKQLEKLEQEKKLKEKELDSLYKIFKKYDKNAYKKLYEKQKKSILETNIFLRGKYERGDTSMLEMCIEVEIKKKLAKNHHIQ